PGASPVGGAGEPAVTDLAIPEGLEPLAVWESAGPDSWADGAPRLPRAGSLNAVARPRISTHRLTRIEFYRADTAFAVLYRVREIPGAVSWYVPPNAEEPAAEPPVIVPLAELPPVYL